MNSALEPAVRAALSALPSCGRIVCALSGGTDSVAMTHCVMTVGAAMGLRVEAAHFNHRLRGAASDRDEAFVRALCRDWSLPLAVGYGSIDSRGAGVEDAARRARYAFLFGAAGDDFLATAHTMDDQAETVLLQLVRGTGLRGLGGMAPVRGRLLRPLLGLRRADTEGYLRAYGLPHTDDETNSGDAYRRNRLRHAALPLLAEENPQIVPALADMAARLRQDEALLAQLTEQALAQARQGTALDCAAANALHPALRARVLRAFAPVELTARHTRALEALIAGQNGSAAVSLPGGWTARRAYDRLWMTPARAETWQPAVLPVPGAAELPGWRIECTICTPEDETSQNRYTFYFSRDTITGQLRLRPRQTGDTLRLPGGSRTLKRLMIDRKIPAWERDALPVLEDNGGVLAVPGLGAQQDRLAPAGAPALRVAFLRQAEVDGGTANVP